MTTIKLGQEAERKRRKLSHESSSFRKCPHWFLRYSVCTNCHTRVNKLDTKPFNYILDGLEMSHEAVTETKRLNTEILALNDKKLHLVLDLDHTLIHTIKVPNLSESEKYLMEEESRDDLIKFEGFSIQLLIKFRPFLHEFLQEANKFFTMYVYTMGSYDYARIIQKLIDPEKVYFGDRIISKKESPIVKSLDLVLVDERGVVIVDDTRDVWPDHGRNLVEINRYNYFRGKREMINGLRSYSEEKKDEDLEEGGLKNVLKLLKEVYEGFFSCGEEELSLKDVRLVLEDLVK